MRFAAIAALLAGSLHAGLFNRPYAWGTPPSKAAWSKQGHVLVFLWNAEGRRFLDLYAYRADNQRLVRLTNLESAEDPINRRAAEKDERQKQYLEPEEGIGAFDIARDGARAAFSLHGDLYLVNTSGDAAALPPDAHQGGRNAIPPSRRTETNWHSRAMVNCSCRTCTRASSRRSPKSKARARHWADGAGPPTANVPSIPCASAPVASCCCPITPAAW